MKNYFNFNRKDKIGVTILSAVILILVVVLNVGYSRSVPDPFDVDMDKITYFTLKDDNLSTADNSASQYKSTPSNELKPFDPNAINLAEWMALGFSEKQASSIVNYRTKYGPFKDKKQIQKLYVVSEEQFNRIEPFIRIKAVAQSNNSYHSYSTTTDNDIADTLVSEAGLEYLSLNSATKEELMSLSGIGDYYSSKIVNYRLKTGGFVDFSQINEMSLPDEVKAVLREMTIINPSEVKKTNINTASKAELQNIPFSNWLLVAEVLKFRDTQEIENLDFLTPEIISEVNKIRFAEYILF